MIQLYNTGIWLLNGTELIPDCHDFAQSIAVKTSAVNKEQAAKGTITWSLLEKHNTSGDMAKLALRFDALASHDITFVGIIQTAKASGLREFPVPYILTNCHNSLCAVGGTLNEDDHLFGLSAAKKYGGIFVPPHLAVIHAYMREMEAACGRMILGSDSHTRYGALGTLAIGEGGGELVKQLLGKTYNIDYPEVICVYLTGRPQPGVGPQDVALSIIGAVFQNNFAKNKVLEFVGEGIAGLSADFRSGIDVMTTETACLSSIWQTDSVIGEYYKRHGRPEAYHRLAPQPVAYYDGAVCVDLSAVKPMIALPFHPSNAYTIEDFRANAGDILRETERSAQELIDNPKVKFNLTSKLIDGRFRAEQGIVAGCAGGTFENLAEVARIVGRHSLGSDVFSLSLYPASQPVMLSLTEQGMLAQLMEAGAIVRSAFCGPCFGAGDVPADGSISLRHTTRNFPNREGSNPEQGQLASVALMDARSIAATAINGGLLTPATDLVTDYASPGYNFNGRVYQNRVYYGFGKPLPDEPLRYGPNIMDWPEIGKLEDNLLLGIASVITDPVTTTDELIPSGETSTFRSNPIGLAQFTLSRKDPAYVGKAKKYLQAELARRSGGSPDQTLPELRSVLERIRKIPGCQQLSLQETGLGSLLYAAKPGDGSAREQAASCQRVLGGCANIAREYATKRYRSNLINWGLLPLLLEDEPPFAVGDNIFLPGIRSAIEQGASSVKGYLITAEEVRELKLSLGNLTDDDRRILLAGCLINYYRSDS